MNKKRFLAAAVVAALSSGLIASGITPAFSKDNPTSTAAPAEETAADQAEEQDFIRVSEDALMTMRNVHSARLAIFDGSPDKAQTYADAAVARIAATAKDEEKYALDTKTPITDDSYVPFDASLTVAKTFVPNEANMKHIAKANEHLHKGQKKEAMEVLKLGEVDVAVSAELVPVKLAQKYIGEAAKLIGEGKYYEANLALKTVEDAVVADTFAIDAVPEAKAKS